MRCCAVGDCANTRQAEAVVALLDDAVAVALAELPQPGRALSAVAVLKAALDPKAQFFKRYGHPPGVSLADLPVEATPAWHASLGFAKWVDARRSLMDGSSVWSRGQIVDEDGGRFHVHFYHYAGGVPYDTAWYAKGSPDLAPDGSRVVSYDVDEKWLQGLGVGSKLDFKDQKGVPFNSTVIDIRNRLGSTKEVRMRRGGVGLGSISVFF